MERLFEKSKYVLPGSQSWEMSSKMCFSNSVPMSSIPLPDATLRWNNQESYQDLKIIENRAIFVWPWNKTREQNRNNKLTEIERFDWFIDRIQTRLAFGWLSKRSGEKTSCRKTDFLETHRYFALTSYCNTIGPSILKCNTYDPQATPSNNLHCRLPSPLLSRSTSRC